MGLVCTGSNMLNCTRWHGRVGTAGILCPSPLCLWPDHTAGTNICLLTAPIIFSVLLLIIQTLINNLFLTGSKFECGCQCSQCCYGGDASNCTKLMSGYCNSDNGFSCLSTNSSNCGPQFSTGMQAGFCSIPSPSNWPAIINVCHCVCMYAPRWMDKWVVDGRS